MISFLSIVQVISSVLIVSLILLQPAKQGASAFAASQGPMGNAAGSTPLFKITMFLAAFLMLSSVIISRYRIQTANISTVDSMTATEVKKSDDESVVDLTQEAPATTSPAPGTAPAPAPEK